MVLGIYSVASTLFDTILPGPILHSLGSVGIFAALVGSNLRSRRAELLCVLVSRDLGIDVQYLRDVIFELG